MSTFNVQSVYCLAPSPPPPAAAATTTTLHTAVNHNDLTYIIVDNEISQIGTKLTKYCCFGK